jgi:DNA-binding response OmpR family regulator
MLTAYGSPENEAEARRRGAHAFLHKPLPLASIAAAMRALLEGH